MNDLRSPLEDRPYRPAAQDNLSHDYEMSLFDRIRYSRWFPLGSVFAAVLIFSGIVSYAYKQGAQTGVNATTPVVAADTAAYKEKPENPGGMDVPFQDAVVFDQLQNQDHNKPEGDTVESLLPPPEQPVSATTPATPPVAAEAAKPAETDSAKPAIADKPVADKPVADKPVADKPAAETLTETAKTVAPATATAAASPAASASVAETIVKEAPQAKPLATETDPESAPIASSSAESKNLEAPVAAPKTEVKTEAKTVAKTEEKPMDKIIEKTIDKPVEKPVAKAPVIAAAPKPIASPAPVAASAPAIASGSYRIQLGAFRDESAARAAWQHVQSQFSQLSGVTPAFPRADLGAKGIFYRAQGTKLSKESADSLCRTINAAKAGSCIVTH